MNTPNYWYWNNYFTKKEIIELNKIIEKEGKELETENEIARDLNNNNIKFSKVKSILHYKIKDKLKSLINDIKYVNQENYGYNIFEMNDKQYHNLNIYSSKINGKYDWHTDKSKNPLTDIKFTILINVSLKDYEGGDFELFDNGIFKIKELNTSGNIVMIKSYMNHRVLPVLKGERRTLALFIKGAKFV